MAAKKTLSLMSLPSGFYDPDGATVQAYLEATGKTEVSNLYDGEQWDYPPRLKKDRARVVEEVRCPESQASKALS